MDDGFELWHHRFSVHTTLYLRSWPSYPSPSCGSSVYDITANCRWDTAMRTMLPCWSDWLMAFSGLLLVKARLLSFSWYCEMLALKMQHHANSPSPRIEVQSDILTYGIASSTSSFTLPKASFQIKSELKYNRYSILHWKIQCLYASKYSSATHFGYQKKSRLSGHSHTCSHYNQEMNVGSDWGPFVGLNSRSTQK